MGYTLHAAALEAEMNAISHGFDGRVGACVGEGRHMACVRGGERFSMQSVMKLLVGVAVLEAVDTLQWKPEYVDPKALDLAIRAVPETTRSNAYDKYRKDVRDTASPKAMAEFLIRLRNGKVLSENFNRFRFAGNG